MFQKRLNEAAIMLCEALSSANITHGFFGGFAVHTLGGERESKDIDCLASGSKTDIIEALKSQSSFTMIPQSRQDFVAFLWKEIIPSRRLSGRQYPVLVKVFVDKFPGARCSMKGVKIINTDVEGTTRGKRTIPILDPVVVFKGKLEACATRSLRSDAIDLRQLASRYGITICNHSAEFAPRTVRLALSRHGELRTTFISVGLGVSRTKCTTKHFAHSRLMGPAQGDIQRALLDQSRVGAVPVRGFRFNPPSQRSRVVDNMITTSIVV